MAPYRYFVWELGESGNIWLGRIHVDGGLDVLGVGAAFIANIVTSHNPDKFELQLRVGGVIKHTSEHSCLCNAKLIAQQAMETAVALREPVVGP